MFENVRLMTDSQRWQEAKRQHLSGKSLALAAERPRGWEYLLFAQVILDEVEKAKVALSGAAQEKGSNESVAVPLVGFQMWAKERLDEICLVVRKLSDLMHSMGGKQEEAFGPPGQPGSV